MRLVLAIVMGLFVCSCNETKVPAPDAGAKVEASVAVDVSTVVETTVAVEAGAVKEAAVVVDGVKAQ